MNHKDTRFFIEHNNYNCPDGKTAVWVLRRAEGKPDKARNYHRVTKESLRRIRHLSLSAGYDMHVNTVTTNGITVVLMHE